MFTELRWILLIEQKKVISICIPTYNRANYLAQALNSLCANLAEDPALKDFLEIVISDNGSTDDTPAIVDGYREKLPLLYHRNDSNIGPVRNLCKAASLAHGEYVWFLSDDDVLNAGALGYLMAFLYSHPDIQYLFYTRLFADKDLQYKAIRVEPSGLPDDLLCNTGLELGAVFAKNISVLGYFSSTVISRDLWNDNLACYSREVHEMSHLELIYQSIREKKCAILAKPGVICRTENTRSFAVNSAVLFDGFIKALLYAKTLGYDPAAVDHAIASVARGGQRLFFIDKMLGHRKGNFRSVFIGMGGDIGSLHKTVWYWASYLPVSVLRILKPLYQSKAAIYRIGNN